MTTTKRVHVATPEIASHVRMRSPRRDFVSSLNMLGPYKKSDRGHGSDSAPGNSFAEEPWRAQAPLHRDGPRSASEGGPEQNDLDRSQRPPNQHPPKEFRKRMIARLPPGPSRRGNQQTGRDRGRAEEDHGRTAKAGDDHGVNAHLEPAVEQDQEERVRDVQGQEPPERPARSREQQKPGPQGIPGGAEPINEIALRTEAHLHIAEPAAGLEDEDQADGNEARKDDPDHGVESARGSRPLELS